MSELIYLVGQISPKYPITYEWRQKLIDKFIDKPDIEFINPCDNPFNRTVLDEGEYAISSERRVNAINVLPTKDYTFCKRSSMAIANMNHYDPNKPLLGSFFELAWYFTMPEKTVIGFAKDLKDYEVQHPFVQQAVTTWCHNEEEVADIVIRYFT
jgi:hypothetical protein